MVRPTFPSASSATSNGLVRNKASKVIDFKTIEWARDALYTTYTFGDKFEYMADIEERCVLLYQACFFTDFAAIQDNGISLILSLEKNP